MSPSLTPDLRKYVEDKIRQGDYASEDALYADAVRAMKEQEEKLAWLRREIQLGVDELERGEGVEWDPEELKRRLREKYPSAFPTRESA